MNQDKLLKKKQISVSLDLEKESETKSNEIEEEYSIYSQDNETASEDEQNQDFFSYLENDHPIFKITENQESKRKYSKYNLFASSNNENKEIIDLKDEENQKISELREKEESPVKKYRSLTASYNKIGR